MPSCSHASKLELLHMCYGMHKAKVTSHVQPKCQQNDVHVQKLCAFTIAHLHHCNSFKKKCSWISTSALHSSKCGQQGKNSSNTRCLNIHKVNLALNKIQNFNFNFLYMNLQVHSVNDSQQKNIYNCNEYKVHYPIR